MNPRCLYRLHPRQIMVHVLAFLLVSLASASTAAAEQSFQSLQAELQPLIDNAASQGIRVSVGAMDLTGAFAGQTLLLGSDGAYHPASTIKLLLIAALMQQVDAGRLSLDNTVAVSAADIVGGMGRLQSETVPQQVTLRRLAELTVTISDNTATNVLVDAVGYDAMAALANQLGLKTMQFGRKMFEAAQPPLRDNYIDARDALELLAQIYKGDFLGNDSRRQILEWMSAQTVKSKIAAGIPAQVPVAHKTGENGPVSHDIGYILMPGREVALVIFSETSTTTDFDTAQAQLNPLVAKIAESFYQAIQP
ncbi:MAG: serine hydrolase [Pseudohongiella sp.]|nr:serine hydrolase [Pseudohongiella sp.]